MPELPDITVYLEALETRILGKCLERVEIRRASLHLVRGENALRDLDPGGIDVTTCSPQKFAERLRSENHTLKRALTDPRLFSGIGNAYSDEILHAAQLSPVALTQTLSNEQIARLHGVTNEILEKWVSRLRAQAGADCPGLSVLTTLWRSQTRERAETKLPAFWA